MIHFAPDAFERSRSASLNKLFKRKKVKSYVKEITEPVNPDPELLRHLARLKAQGDIDALSKLGNGLKGTIKKASEAKVHELAQPLEYLETNKDKNLVNHQDNLVQMTTMGENIKKQGMAGTQSSSYARATKNASRIGDKHVLDEHIEYSGDTTNLVDSALDYANGEGKSSYTKARGTKKDNVSGFDPASKLHHDEALSDEHLEGLDDNNDYVAAGAGGSGSGGTTGNTSSYFYEDPDDNNQGKRKKRKIHSLKYHLAWLVSPIVIVWVFIGLVFSNNVVDLHRSANSLHEIAIPDAERADVIKQDMVRIAYLVDLIAQSMNVTSAHNNYQSLITMLKDSNIYGVPEFAQDITILRHKLDNLYEAKKELHYRSKQTFNTWLTYYGSVQSLFIMTGQIGPINELARHDHSLIMQGYNSLEREVGVHSEHVDRFIAPQCAIVFNNFKDVHRDFSKYLAHSPQILPEPSHFKAVSAQTAAAITTAASVGINSVKADDEIVKTMPKDDDWIEHDPNKVWTRNAFNSTQKNATLVDSLGINTMNDSYRNKNLPADHGLTEEDLKRLEQERLKDLPQNDAENLKHDSISDSEALRQRHYNEPRFNKPNAKSSYGDVYPKSLDESPAQAVNDTQNVNKAVSNAPTSQDKIKINDESKAIADDKTPAETIDSVFIKKEALKANANGIQHKDPRDDFHQNEWERRNQNTVAYLYPQPTQGQTRPAKFHRQDEQSIFAENASSDVSLNSDVGTSSAVSSIMAATIGDSDASDDARISGQEQAATNAAAAIAAHKLTPEQRAEKDHGDIIDKLYHSGMQRDEKFLFSCRAYTQAYADLRVIRSIQKDTMRRFNLAYSELLMVITNINKKSESLVRMSLANSCQDIAQSANKIYTFNFIAFIAAVCTMIYVVWYVFTFMIGSVWQLREFANNFRNTYRIPDPRESMVTEVREIVHMMRPVLEDYRLLRKNSGALIHVSDHMDSVTYFDPLTRLHNRRALEEIILGDFDLQNMSAVLMIDIDNFAQFNRREGSRKGDKALTLVADVLQQNLFQSKDLLFRYNADTFFIILQQCSVEDMIDVVKRIVVKVKSLNLQYNIAQSKYTEKDEQSLINTDLFVSERPGSLGENASRSPIGFMQNRNVPSADGEHHKGYELTPDGEYEDTSLSKKEDKRKDGVPLATPGAIKDAPHLAHDSMDHFGFGIEDSLKSGTQSVNDEEAAAQDVPNNAPKKDSDVDEALANKSYGHGIEGYEDLESKTDAKGKKKKKNQEVDILLSSDAYKLKKEEDNDDFIAILSVSIGISYAEETTTTGSMKLKDHLNRARKALISAKHRGGDKVVIYDDVVTIRKNKIPSEQELEQEESVIDILRRNRAQADAQAATSNEEQGNGNETLSKEDELKAYASNLNTVQNSANVVVEYGAPESMIAQSGNKRGFADQMDDIEDQGEEQVATTLKQAQGSAASNSDTSAKSNQAEPVKADKAKVNAQDSAAQAQADKIKAEDAQKPKSKSLAGHGLGAMFAGGIAKSGSSTSSSSSAQVQEHASKVLEKPSLDTNSAGRDESTWASISVTSNLRTIHDAKVDESSGMLYYNEGSGEDEFIYTPDESELSNKINLDKRDDANKD